MVLYTKLNDPTYEIVDVDYGLRYTTLNDPIYGVGTLRTKCG